MVLDIPGCRPLCFMPVPPGTVGQEPRWEFRQTLAAGFRTLAVSPDHPPHHLWSRVEQHMRRIESALAQRRWQGSNSPCKQRRSLQRVENVVPDRMRRTGSHERTFNHAVRRLAEYCSASPDEIINRHKAFAIQICVDAPIRVENKILGCVDPLYVTLESVVSPEKPGMVAFNQMPVILVG